MDIIKEFFAGSRLALSRSISMIENEADGAQEVLKAIYPYTGNAQIIGITGAPGSGKSTLTDCLAKVCRRKNQKVGIIAVDPTSPFTGGAILGDRIRMNDLTTDPGVFIRSMGTRGSLGGIALKTAEAIKLMDAFGMDVIFVETVGVGQSEVDIVKYTDTVLVVLTPGLGDDIQAIKAGILEIADIFVINKADVQGVEKLQAELNMMLDLGGKRHNAQPKGGICHILQQFNTAAENDETSHEGEVGEWRTQIVKTVASCKDGIEELSAAIDSFAKYAQVSGLITQRRIRRTEEEVVQALQSKIFKHIYQTILQDDSFLLMLEGVVKKTEDPYSIVEHFFCKNTR